MYTLISSARFVVVALVITLTFTQAKAADQNYYWYYTAASSYPTGGGTVYISDAETAEADRKYDTNVEFKTAPYAYSGSTDFYGYAKPNNGYIFVGWKTLDASYYDDIIENGSINIKDYLSKDIVGYNANMSFNLSTNYSSTNNEVDAYPYSPNNTVVALFGHVALTYIPGQKALGTMEVEDPAVEIGEFTYITATPAEGAEFLYWLDDKGNKYEGNRLEIEITRNITYTPMFAAPNYKTIDFGEGCNKIISNLAYDTEYDNDYVSHVYICPQVMSSYNQVVRYDTTKVTENVEVDTIINGVDSSVIVQKEVTKITAVDSTIYYEAYPNSFTNSKYITDKNKFRYGFDAGNAVIVSAKGLITLHYNEKGQNSSIFSNNKLVAAGAEGTDIGLLPQDTVKYYIFDEKTNTFNAVTSGIVPAGSGYLAITNDMQEYRYDTFYYVTTDKYDNIVKTDVNKDGDVDTQDVLNIYDAMQSGNTEGFDVNGDNNVDTQDVLNVYDFMQNN